MRRVVTKGGTYKVTPKQPEPTRQFTLKAKKGPLRILVPPGVGDIHWVLLRLRGILRESGNTEHKPIITVCSGDPAYDKMQADKIIARLKAELLPMLGGADQLAVRRSSSLTDGSD